MDVSHEKVPQLKPLGAALVLVPRGSFHSLLSMAAFIPCLNGSFHSLPQWQLSLLALASSLLRSLPPGAAVILAPGGSFRFSPLGAT
jgi:hypothetical protein